MNTVISYDTVMGVLAKPPSLDPCPNFFNLRALWSHFAQALKHIPCPQLPINGWSCTVLSPNMYDLIDPTPFHLNIALKTDVLNFKFPPSFFGWWSYHSSLFLQRNPHHLSWVCPWKELCQHRHQHLSSCVWYSWQPWIRCLQCCSSHCARHHWLELHNVAQQYLQSVDGAIR